MSLLVARYNRGLTEIWILLLTENVYLIINQTCPAILR